MLAVQLRAYGQIFADLAAAMVEHMTTQQRDANREFTPVISAVMEAAYTICSNEHGMLSCMQEWLFPYPY